MAELGADSAAWVPLGLSVPRLLGETGQRVRSTAGTQRRLQLYDTGDGRLTAAGAELSFNGRDGWTWRRGALGHPKLAALEWAAPPATHIDELLEWTRAYRRGHDLDVQASVVLHRRSHHLGHERTDDLLTVDEERYDEQVGGRWTPRLRRLVVRSGTGGAAATSAIRLIRDQVSGEEFPALALLRPGLVRSPSLRVPASTGSGAGELLLRSAGLSLVQWLHFDCEVSGGGAAEALRKMRVALRRLRSDLQTFSPLLDRGWSDGLRERLGTLAGHLGVVRDAEVLVARLAELIPLLPDADHQVARGLLDVAGEQLAGARAELLGILATADYAATLESALCIVTAPRLAAAGRAPATVTQLARRPWRRLREHVASLEDTADDAQLHRARILTKRARHAAEACVPAVGGPAASSAEKLAHLQTVLGDHHDAAVTSAWLRRQSAASAGLAFSAGQLAGLEVRRLEEAGQAWPAAWAAASRGRDWRWLRG